MFPHLSRVMRSLLIPDADPAEDIPAQLVWLMAQAQTQGYRDVDDLAVRNGAEFERLAAAWRAHQELARLTLTRPLSAAARTVVTVLGYAKRALAFVSSLIKRGLGARSSGSGVVPSDA